MGYFKSNAISATNRQQREREREHKFFKPDVCTADATMWKNVGLAAASHVTHPATGYHLQLPPAQPHPERQVCTTHVQTVVNMTYDSLELPTTHVCFFFENARILINLS